VADEIVENGHNQSRARHRQSVKHQVRHARKSRKLTNKAIIFDSARVAAFSDAVIAVAITLLVLNIRPNVAAMVDAGATWREVGNLLPSVAAAALSFWVISRFWITNQLFFKSLKVMNMRTLTINTFFLFLIAILPFPTALLAAHVNQATVVMYAGFLAVTSFTQALLWRQLTDKVRADDVARTMIVFRVWQYIGATIIFLVSIGISFLNSYVAIAFWILFGFSRLFGETASESFQHLDDFLVRRGRDSPPRPPNDSP
jgi:uncharacterized membrane protein